MEASINPQSLDGAQDNKWTPPPTGFLKVNTDASYDASSKREGVAAIVKDGKGYVIHGSVAVCSTMSAIVAEAIALKKSLQQALALSSGNLIMESNAHNVIKALISSSFLLSWKVSNVI